MFLICWHRDRWTWKGSINFYLLIFKIIYCQIDWIYYLSFLSHAGILCYIWPLCTEWLLYLWWICFLTLNLNRNFYLDFFVINLQWILDIMIFRYFSLRFVHFWTISRWWTWSESDITSILNLIFNLRFTIILTIKRK